VMEDYQPFTASTLGDATSVWAKEEESPYQEE
jgi:hypothetical protein